MNIKGITRGLKGAAKIGSRIFKNTGKQAKKVAQSAREKTTKFTAKTGLVPRNKRVKRAEEAQYDNTFMGKGEQQGTISFPKTTGGALSSKQWQKNISDYFGNSTRSSRGSDVIRQRANSNAKRVRKIDLLQDELATGRRKYKVRNADGTYNISSAKPNKKALGGSIKRVPTRYESLKD